MLRYVFVKAREQNAEGEEFRTGRPPTWRIALYCLIAVAIPLYFFYPKLNELQPQIKLLFYAVILILPVPAFVKKNKTWLAEHQKIILYALYVVLALSVLLKLWDIFAKK